MALDPGLRWDDGKEIREKQTTVSFFSVYLCRAL